MQSCDEAATRAVVTAISLRAEERFGAQGGSHVEVVATITGEDLGACVAQVTRSFDQGGSLVEENRRNVRVSPLADGRFETAPILLFDTHIAFVPVLLRVEIGGVAAEERYGPWPVLDAGDEDAGMAP
jgi:hypothetical protein